MRLKKNSVDVTTYFKHTAGLTITSLDLQYTRSGAAPAAKVDATALAAADSAHGDNKAFEVDGTNSPGIYRVDWPDAAFIEGVDEVVLVLNDGSGNIVEKNVEIYDSEFSQRVVSNWTELVAANTAKIHTVILDGACTVPDGTVTFNNIRKLINVYGSDVFDLNSTGPNAVAIFNECDTYNISVSVGASNGNYVRINGGSHKDPETTDTGGTNWLRVADGAIYSAGRVYCDRCVIFGTNDVADLSGGGNNTFMSDIPDDVITKIQTSMTSGGGKLQNQSDNVQSIKTESTSIKATVESTNSHVRG